MFSRLLAALATGLALSSLAAAADPSGELGQLRQEAAQLRQSLNRLDARIQALESQGQGPAPGTTATLQAPAPQVPAIPAAAASAGASAPAAATSAAPAAPIVTPAALAAAASQSPVVQLRRNWSQIERGMPQQNVQSLLGDPEKVMQIDGNTAWIYAYPGLGRGSVFFNGEGKVSSSQTPTFGWGW